MSTCKSIFRATVYHRRRQCLQFTHSSTQCILGLRLGEEGHVHKFRERPFSGVASWKAKVKASIKVNDLPQGAIRTEPTPLEEDMPAYPTVVLQARTNMRKFDNCVLLTRVGGFYELYFEHAEEYGPLLNLKVAQKRTNAGPVSMVSNSFICLPIHSGSL
jgi:hypothetical protein